MKNSFRFLPAFAALFFSIGTLSAQQKAIIPDLSRIDDTTYWTQCTWEMSYSGDSVYMNDKLPWGLIKLKGVNFSNGKIECDIKGRDMQGGSFVGLAFHGQYDTTFDVVYFRPFNFRNPERKNHSVQYVSLPHYDWYVLREKHPGVYENSVTPVPDPNEWFHVTIEVKNPVVRVFVNDSNTPSLTVNLLNSRKDGWLGLWVSLMSDGTFRNLKIFPE